MKTKYQIIAESSSGSKSAVKVFKGDQNESNAIAYLDDPRNLRIYGFMSLVKVDQDGNKYEWDGEKGWIAK